MCVDRSVAALLFFSLLFTAVFNTDWGAVNSGHAPGAPAYRFLVSLGYAFVCFTLFSLTRVTLVVLTPLAVVLPAVAKNVLFVNKSEEIDFSAVRDENLIAPFEKALSGGEENRLVVVHMAGSHWRYDSHYPAQFRKFTPTCDNTDPSSCTPEAIRNSYDNTLLYADFVVGELIKRTAGGKSIVFFVSDHGEALGENDRYLHHRASNDPNMRSAATFVWVSEAFAAAFPERVAALRENRPRRLAHDNIFHSLLDCAGVEAPFIDPGLSLCRPGVRERPPDPAFDTQAAWRDLAAWE